MAPPRTLTSRPLLWSESMSRRTVSSETFRVFERDSKLTFPFFQMALRICVCRSSFIILCRDFDIVSFGIEDNTFIIAVPGSPGLAVDRVIVLTQPFGKRIDLVSAADRDGEVGQPHAEAPLTFGRLDAGTTHQLQPGPSLPKIDKIRDKLLARVGIFGAVYDIEIVHKEILHDFEILDPKREMFDLHELSLFSRQTAVGVSDHSATIFPCMVPQ